MNIKLKFKKFIIILEINNSHWFKKFHYKERENE
jgi:hypothetical protein